MKLLKWNFSFSVVKTIVIIKAYKKTDLSASGIYQLNPYSIMAQRASW